MAGRRIPQFIREKEGVCSTKKVSGATSPRGPKKAEAETVSGRTRSALLSAGRAERNGGIPSRKREGNQEKKTACGETG